MHTAAAVRRLRRAPLLAALGLALAALPGCIIDFGGDDEPCAQDLPAGTAGAPISTLRLDPETLVCRQVDLGCGGCGPCAQPSAVEINTWAECQTQCTGLDIAVCGQTAGCRQTWDEQCLLTDALCTLPDGGYLGCFAVDTTGPVQGACDGLAAQECSRHDDCLGTYRRDERCANGVDEDFDGAIDEPDECLTFGLCIDEIS